MAECAHFFTRKGIGGIKVPVCLRRPFPKPVDPEQCSICGNNTIPEKLRGDPPNIADHPHAVHATPPRTARREIPLTEIARIGQEERSSPTQHK